MLIGDMHWQQVEAYLENDDRAVLPLGSTEQHAYLSLSVDTILAGKMAQDSAEPLSIPVYPTLPYGLTAYFTSYPGTISLRMQTYLSLVRDILDGMANSGFRRILIVNGHGGNSPASALAQEWMNDNPGVSVKFHNWWRSPGVWAKVQEIDPIASHASWMENFPWTRLAGVDMPSTQKPMIDLDKVGQLNADGVRAMLGDGNFGGYYQRSDEEMLSIWEIGVAEARAKLVTNW